NVLALLRAQERWDEAIALARELFTSLRDSGELVNSAYAGLHLVACLLGAGRIAEAAAEAASAWTFARQIDLPLMGATVALLAARVRTVSTGVVRLACGDPGTQPAGSAGGNGLSWRPWRPAQAPPIARFSRMCAGPPSVPSA